MTLPASEETVPATDEEIGAAEAMLNALDPNDLDETQEDVAYLLRALIARIRSETKDANIGRSIVSVIGTEVSDPTSPLHNWSPAEHYDEVITDLVEMVQATREQAVRECAENGWQRIYAVPDNTEGPFLVTNNPLNRNAFGRPSHVWCVQSIHADDEGSFCAFDGFQKIHDLKLFMPVPPPSLSQVSAKT